MPLPQMTYVIVTGKYSKGDAAGNPEVGSVVFRRNVRLVSSDQDLVVAPGEVEVALDENGEFSVSLPATNDPDYSPTFTYQVTENLSSQVGDPFYIALPYDTPGGTVDIADIAPVASNETGDSYVRTSMMGQPFGLATLDANGLLEVSQDPGIGGGGGGGGTPASTVTEEKNFGQASVVGTSVLYARADHSHGTPDAQTLASLGAEAAGTAQSKMDSHLGAADPHGDRAYSDAQLAGGLATKAPLTHTHGASTQAWEWYIDTAVVGEGTLRKRNNTTANLTIIAVRVEACIVGPSGGPLTVDVNINGTTIFTTQANRPTITDGSTDSGKVTNMNVTTILPGQYMTIDIDSIGLNVPGSGILVTVVLG